MHYESDDLLSLIAELGTTEKEIPGSRKLLEELRDSRWELEKVYGLSSRYLKEMFLCSLAMCRWRNILAITMDQTRDLDNFLSSIDMFTSVEKKYEVTLTYDPCKSDSDF